MILEVPPRFAEKPPDRELRAGERVLSYLTAEFERSTFKDGERLPTNKELALRLNVSPGTVQAILQKLAKEGRISSQRGSGTYLVARLPEPAKDIRIGIGASLQKLHDPDGWISRIGGGIFQAALKQQALIEGVSNSNAQPEVMIEELMEKKSQLDALILLPYSAVSRHKQLIEAYESEGKPVVHIHPPSLIATANFTSTGFMDAAYAIARVWRRTGRKHLLFFTTMCQSQNVTISDQLRYAGLVSGWGAQGETSLTACESIGNLASQEAGYQTIKRLLASGKKIPDAVYCSGDWLALGAFQAFEEAEIRVPAEVSIVGAGGMNLSRTICPNLTRVRNDLERVGQEAVEMVVRRIRHNGIALPGVVVPASFMGGSTTSAEENKLLEIGLHRKATKPDASQPTNQEAAAENNIPFSATPKAAAPLKTPSPRVRRSGFSLVEVTIAIGIVAFAMVTLMGVIPIGLISTQDAMQQTARSHIIKQISSDLGMLPFADMPAYLAANQFYDYEGNRLTGASTNSRIYIATMTDALPSYPGSSNLANLDERFERVAIKIRRIAESTNAEFRTTISVFNASGKP